MIWFLKAFIMHVIKYIDITNTFLTTVTIRVLLLPVLRHKMPLKAWNDLSTSRGPISPLAPRCMNISFLQIEHRNECIQKHNPKIFPCHNFRIFPQRFPSTWIFINLASHWQWPQQPSPGQSPASRKKLFSHWFLLTGVTDRPRALSIEMTDMGQPFPSVTSKHSKCLFWCWIDLTLTQSPLFTYLLSYKV